MGGTFVAIEAPTRLSEIPEGKHLETLYAPGGSMAPFAAMVERMGLASRAVLDGAALSMHRRMAGRPKATLDDWRHAVKEHFKPRVIERLADPTLSATASYQQMRQIVDGLGHADRGALVEAWYQRRHAPTAQPRRAYEVTRTTGDHAGKTESRVTDLIVDGEIREIKDIEGPLDAEQFGAYVDLLRDDKLAGSMGVKKLRYVFTKEKGAIANLELLARQYQLRGLRDRLTIEVFDASGQQHYVNHPGEALALLTQLKGSTR